MRKRRFPLMIVAVLISALPAWAQSGQPPARAGFGPPPPSEELAKRPQTPGAKGDQQRHYYFAAAGREMPYRLYVPQSYDPIVGAPLVVALHGFGGNQDYFFAYVKDLPALCEKYGFIFAAPMGLSTDGWYGAPLSIPGNAPRSSGAPPPPQVRTPDEETRYRALSEADVMNVLDIVRKEYTVDPSRIYLMGHSMGGFGTWWLGQKYAETWAAIAPMSGVLPDVDYQLHRLTRVPVQISIGGAETAAWVEASRTLAETMKGRGMTVAYVEPAAATHTSMIEPTTPQALEFFSRHRRATSAPPAPVGQTPAASPDEAAVREVVRQYVDARERRDPAALEALFTADADQHTTSGEWRRGRAQVVPGALDSSTRNPGARTIAIETVRFVTPDVAVADGPYEISGAGGVRRMWTTFVIRRAADGWRIAAIRNMMPTGAPAAGGR